MIMMLLVVCDILCLFYCDYDGDYDDEEDDGDDDGAYYYQHHEVFCSDCHKSWALVLLFFLSMLG